MAFTSPQGGASGPLSTPLPHPDAGRPCENKSIVHHLPWQYEYGEEGEGMKSKWER